MRPPRAAGVVEAEARGDVHVLGADDVGAFEVGDGAGDAEDAGVAAGGEGVAVVELGEQAEGARGDAADLADLAGGELGVAGLRLAGEAQCAWRSRAATTRSRTVEEDGCGLAAQGVGRRGVRRA